MQFEHLTEPFVNKLLKALDEVHTAGVIWGDCRPDNIGIVGGEPLLIDWNLAILTNERTHPHNGTRCFVSQRLLRMSPNQRVERVPDDDKESLLKALITIRDPHIRAVFSNVHEPAECAETWQNRYPFVTLSMDEAFTRFKSPLRFV